MTTSNSLHKKDGVAHLKTHNGYQHLMWVWPKLKGPVHGSARAHHMLYHLRKQYDHVIMLSKNQSAHSSGSKLHLINLNYLNIAVN